MGGDHKCPLCSATFTRPQHVGRHLRAHTGDRPYECKECPLRFARSDLLSRHVNKAHKPPEEGDAAKKGDKAGKKARRKSIATAMTDDDGDAPDADGPIASEKARRSSFAHPQGTYPGQAGQVQGVAGYQPQLQQQPQGQGAQQQQQQAGSQLQAQKLYPHHPLLASTSQAPGQTGPYTSQWSSAIQTAGLNGAVTALPPNSYAAGLGIANPLYSTAAAMGMGAGGPYNGLPMRLTGSEQGGLAGQQNRNPNIASWAFDFGFKKRACDQCNHSKVRCDFSDPCARCSHRNLKCTYNKPSKSRGMATPVNLAGRLSYPMSTGTSNTYLASSVSPVSQGSQHSSQGAAGSITNTSPIARASMPGAPGLPRRGSIGSTPVNAYASAVPNNIASSAQYLQQLQQQNQERQQLAAQQWMTTAASMGGVPSMLPGGYPVTATMQQQPLYPMQQQQQQAQQVSPLSNTSVGPTQSQGLSPSNGTALQVSLGAQANSTAQSHALQKKKSSSASPGTHLATTPALTLGSSQTTSPSSSEELLERKGSQMGALAGQNWQQSQMYQPMPQLPGGQQQPIGLLNAQTATGKDAGGDTKPNLSLLQPTFAPDGSVQMSGISPTTTAPSMDFLNMQFGAPGQMGVVWPQQMDAAPVATIDPRTQFRSNNANEDDDAASVQGSSSAASVYHFDPDENMVNAFAQPRRSSVGHALWTNAFDSMTLQDGTVIPGSAVSDALNDPFTASRVAQAVSQRRPTFPLEIQGMDQTGSKIPSMSDVKDLWKLFMSDPMTSSVTPSGDRHMDFGNLAGPGGNVVTPRPDMGRRTLSKSNSMPDLKSPPAESASASSGTTATPRAVDSKATSYVPGNAAGAAGALVKTEPKADGNGGNAQASGQPDDAAMRKWTEEIRHRQASFNFQPAMNGKIGGKGNTPPSAGGPSPATSAVSPPSNPGSTTSQPTMLPPETLPNQQQPSQQQQQQQMPPPPNRPMASIFQRSGALQQTLAPERTPSWGQSFEIGIPTQASFAKPGPSKLSSTMTASTGGNDSDAQNDASRPPASTAVPIMAGSTSTSVPTSQARPGNKRLASQTLMALEGKKADLGGAGHDFDLAAFDDFTFDLSSAGGGSGTIGGGGITPGLQAMQGLWGIGSVSEMSGGKA